MKSAGSPLPIRSLAMAAARWVLPLPLGPVKTIQMAGSSANARLAVYPARNHSLVPSRPAGMSVSKLKRVREPRLLRRWRRSRRTSVASSRTQSQGSALPKRGWSTGRSRRTKPAPPHTAQTDAASSAIAGNVSGCVSKEALLRAFERISSSRFMGAALLSPVHQDAFDVAPAAGVEFGGFAECVLDPVFRIRCFGFHKPFADQRSDGADLLFVEAEDARPLRFRTRGHHGRLRAQLQIAGASARNCPASGGVVDEVDRYRPGRASQFQGQQGTRLRTCVQPGIETSAAAADRFE